MKTDSDNLAPHSHSRFRWMAGSTAAAVAASSTAIAETVQITQTGNSINATSGSLNADLTGDGTADIPMLVSMRNSGTSPANPMGSTVRFFNFVEADSSGGSIAFALFSNRYNLTMASGTEYYVSAAGNSSFGPNPKTLRSLHPVVFTDARINGGTPSNGFLDIRSASLTPTNNSITFVRLVFDDASPTAPTGIITGGADKAWLSPAERAAVLSQISRLSRKIKKLKGKVRKKKQVGTFKKALKLNRKVRKLKKKQRALRASL